LGYDKPDVVVLYQIVSNLSIRTVEVPSPQRIAIAYWLAEVSVGSAEGGMHLKKPI
jgi:hypothetical protein